MWCRSVRRRSLHPSPLLLPPLTLSAQILSADRGRQAQEDAGEGKVEAVEVGSAGGGVVGSTDRSSSNVHSGHVHTTELGSEASDHAVPTLQLGT